MPTDYTLAELSKLADVTPRTIRYYIGQGLLPSPAGGGPAARYTDEHLGRLRVIKRMQAAHLPLGEIRSLMRTGEAAALYGAEPAASTANSASDYIRDLLARRSPTSPGPTPMPNLPPPPAADPGPPPTSPQTRVSEPDRGTWERISLHPDIELHVRRPLSRLQNKRVERLVSIARQLLEEE